MHARQLTSALAAAAAAALAGCAGASAPGRAAATTSAGGAVTWSATADVSTGVEISNPALGMSASGASLLIFGQTPDYQSQTTTLLAATAAPGGGFGPARVLVPNADAPALAVGVDGRAVLSYAARDGRGYGRAMIVFGSVDGTFGPPTSLGRRDAPRAIRLARDGTALVLYDSYLPGPRAVDVQLVAPDGKLGRTQHLGEVELSSASTIAEGPDGTIAIVSTRYHDDASSTIRVAVRRPGEPVEMRTALRGRYAEPSVAVGPGGSVAVAATSIRDVGEVASYGGVVTAEQPAGARRFSSPKRLPVHPRHDPYAFKPQVAFGPDGARVVTWVEDADPSDTESEGETARGRVIAWSGQRRHMLDTSAREVALTSTPRGVLALTDTGPWLATLLTGRQAQPVAAPAGESSAYGTSNQSDRALLTVGGRVAFAWLSDRARLQAAVGMIAG